MEVIDISDDIFDVNFLGFDFDFTGDLALPIWSQHPPSTNSSDSIQTLTHELMQAPLAQDANFGRYSPQAPQNYLPAPVYSNLPTLAPPSVPALVPEATNVTKSNANCGAEAVLAARKAGDDSSASIMGGSDSSSKRSSAKKRYRKGSSGSTSAKKSKVAEPSATAQLPTVAATDVRRSYTRIILNAFNSCDVMKIKDVLYGYCDSSDNYNNVILINRYEGIQNPYGRNYVELKGVQTIVDMWSTLIKSAPDFMFSILETRACYCPVQGKDSLCLVASRFSWFGTRVLDIKIAERANEEILQNKLMNSQQYSIQEDEVMREVIAEKTRLLDSKKKETVSSIADLKEGVKEAENKNAGEESSGDNKKALISNLFDSSVNTNSALQSPTFFLDEKPLAKKLHMQCTGTFLVYICNTGSSDMPLRSVNQFKVVKMEFAFTAVDENQV